MFRVVHAGELHGERGQGACGETDQRAAERAGTEAPLADRAKAQRGRQKGDRQPLQEAVLALSDHRGVGAMEGDRAERDAEPDDAEDERRRDEAEQGRAAGYARFQAGAGEGDEGGDTEEELEGDARRPEICEGAFAEGAEREDRE